MGASPDLLGVRGAQPPGGAAASAVASQLRWRVGCGKGVCRRWFDSTAAHVFFSIFAPLECREGLFPLGAHGDAMCEGLLRDIHDKVTSMVTLCAKDCCAEYMTKLYQSDYCARGCSAHDAHCKQMWMDGWMWQKNCLHFSICACHPCAGAMLIFSVSFQF